VKAIFSFLMSNWVDLLLVIGGASAFVVYFWQKRNETKIAATLILEQIDSVEKAVKKMKDEHLASTLNDRTVYLAQVIDYEGAWATYQYLLIQELSQIELNLIQEFFETAYQIEKARADIVESFKSGWQNKSLALSLVFAKLHDPTIEYIPNTMEQRDILAGEFLKNSEHTVGFNPKMAYDLLSTGLEKFTQLSGTTAYDKLVKKSYRKK